MDTQGLAIDQNARFSYLGQLTTVLAASLVEAMALAQAGDSGRECAQRVLQTRELYNELLEESLTAGPSGDEFARGLADSIGVRLDELERRTASAVVESSAGPAKQISPPANGRAELWHVWPTNT